MKHHTPNLANILNRGSDSAWVACGGILGTLARHGVDVLLLPHVPHLGFPWTTFAINVSGSALLGFVMAWAEESDYPPRWLKTFVGIGFCGAFTTFSTASVEILLLGREGRAELAATYLGASLVCGILAVTITTALAVHFCTPSRAKRSH